jgi:hypothetical protein
MTNSQKAVNLLFIDMFLRPLAQCFNEIPLKVHDYRYVRVGHVDYVIEVEFPDWDPNLKKARNQASILSIILLCQ